MSQVLVIVTFLITMEGSGFKGGFCGSSLSAPFSPDLGFFEYDGEGYYCEESRNKDSLVIPLLLSIFDRDRQEKIEYLLKVSNTIRSTQEEFLKNYAKANKQIIEVFTQIAQFLGSKLEQLQSELNEIKNTKMSEWDRQLSNCHKDIEWLMTLHNKQTESLNCIRKYTFPKDLDLVDAADFNFDFGAYSILSCLQNLDRISFSDGSSSLHEDTVQRRILPRFTIGSSGHEEGKFCRPWGVCTDGLGRILVADRSNHRIQIFSESGKFCLQFGKEGSAPGEFSRPTGITVDKKERVIVADKDNHRIQVFTSNGCFLYAFGKQGTRPGEFCYPWDVAVNENCEIAVSDSKNHCVQLFNERGGFLAKFGNGKLRSDLRELDCPRGLAFLNDGKLMVTDFNNHRIVVINKSFKSCTHFGREGGGQSEFFRPQGIAFHKSGMFAVADGKNYRIQVFSCKGNQWSLLKVFGSEGTSSGQFDCPQGIAFHPNGSIIVVDFGNERVQVF